MPDTGHLVFASPPRLTAEALTQSLTMGARCHHRAPLAIPPTLLKRAPEAHEEPSTRRTKIWEFNQNLHCSLIGTCLSTTELRQTLAKLNLVPAGMSDHELHHQAVSMAARHDQAAKLLHKALDRRHRLAISQCGKARTDVELIAQWREAVKRGEIPGAYWAVLTHPAATQAVVRMAFGEVHMLSHLVGAANRADIRRLCDLEQRNAELEMKLQRQQDALHLAVASRDASIRDLRQTLRERLTVDPPMAESEDLAALRGLTADLEKRLMSALRGRAANEIKLADLRAALERERLSRQAADNEVRTLRAELAVVEPHSGEDAAPPDVRLDGRRLLYVGGRPNMVSHLRVLAERAGATLLHHDGGVEHHPDLLAGLTSRADTVMFPVDCVSHDAALTVKRLCQQAGKPFIPLRSSGAASFLAALRRPELNLA